jgi:glutamate-5-semialdehyde dehydrogenase
MFENIWRLIMTEQEMQSVLEKMGKQARRAAAALAVLPADAKQLCLEKMAEALIAAQNMILSANAKDVDAARKSGMDAAKIDRLILDDSRISAMSDGLRQVAAQKDPVGKVLSVVTRPNGLEISKISVPFGVK